MTTTTQPPATAAEPAKPKPYRFSHSDIVLLVGIAAKTANPAHLLSHACAALDGAPPAAVEAKLLELNLLSKPPRLTLTEDEGVRIDKVCAALVTATDDPEKRVLFARHAIKALRAWLPTRTKGEAANG